MVTPSDVTTGISQLNSLRPYNPFPFPSDVVVGLLQKMANATPSDVQTAIASLNSLKVGGVFPEEVIIGLLGKLVDVQGNGSASNLSLGSNRITIGTVEPTVKNNGDIWYETVDNNGTFVPETNAGDGQLKWGFPWYYNFDLGSWESPRRSANFNLNNLAAGSSAAYFFPLPENFGLRWKPLRTNFRFFVAGTNNGSNYWQFQQSVQTKAASQSILATPNTSLFTGSNWHELKTTFTPTTSYDLSTAASQQAIFRVDVSTALGTPGNLFTGIQLDYNWVR